MAAFLKRAALAAALLVPTLASCAPADPPGAIRLPDQRFYTAGAYSAFASPWASFADKSLVRGHDFEDSLVVRPGRFPNDTRIEWRWPFHRPRASGVWGYIVLGYGNYDDTRPEAPVPPSRVRDIGRLREDVAWEGSAIAGGYNLLNEFYLTREAGRSDTKAIEVGLLLHPYDRGDPSVQGGRRIGRYRDGAGRGWEVVMNGTYCMFLPDADVTEGTIDVKAMLAFLRANRVITGDEWFNGIGIGVEPVWGRGSATIRRWKVDYSDRAVPA